MWRAIRIFLLIAVVAAAIAWFADRPGEVTLVWLGYEIETSLMFALAAVAFVVAVLLIAFGVARRLVGAPGSITGFVRHRRRQKGYAALSQGMIALGAGDSIAAQRLSAQAEKLLQDEPLTLLLKAQAAQAKGDEETAGRVFRAMLQSPETEVLGLRGLFVQARRKNDAATARTVAERAIALKPDLPWAVRAVLSLQSAEGDWQGAERTLETARHNRLIGKDDASRQRAVLLTAQALEIEETNPDAALMRAQEAHRLAPALVPAAVVAGRILAAKGETRKAAKILEKTWKLSPHPDIAEVYAAARTGDSPRDRLKRVRMLVQRSSGGVEGPIAIARAAIEAGDWVQARSALSPLLEDRPQSRVCALMAEIEDGEHGDKGRVRQWLARAVHAPRDPMWTADGYASETWAPVSPVTGTLDAFEWKVPVEGLGYAGEAFVDDDEGEPAAEPAAPVLELPAESPPVPEEPPVAAEPEETAARKVPEAPAPALAAEPAPASGNGAGKIDGQKARPAFVAPPVPDDPGPDTDAEFEDEPVGLRKPVAD